jgi:ABC-type transport system involved in cytochrome c biogenesis permease subunit
MNWFDVRLAQSATIVYFVAAVLLGLEILLRKAQLRFAWQGVLLVAVGIHAASLVARTVASGEMPFTNLYEYTVFLSFAIALVYLIFFRTRLPAAASFAVIIVVLLLIGSAAFGLRTPPGGVIMPALKSYWLYIHVSLTALGETFFAVAFVSSMIYLFRKGTADRGYIETLDRLTYKAVSMGFPIFTAGALVAGAIWAKRAWGAYWSWDPKEVLSLVVWLVYAVYLHARLVRGMRGTTVAVISVVGFALTIFTIFGNQLFGGLHVYDTTS